MINNENDKLEASLKHVILLERVLCVSIVLICISTIVIASWTTFRNYREGSNKICNAVCNNDRVVSCISDINSLNIACVAPDTKVIRTIEIK